MAESGFMNSVFEALKPKLLGALAGVLRGGFRLAEIPELKTDDPNAGKRPYGVVLPVAVRDTRFTNVNKYASAVFAFEIHADTFDELDGVLVPAVTNAIQHKLTGTTAPNSAVKILSVRPGDTTFEKIENIWMASVEFTVQACQVAAQSV